MIIILHARRHLIYKRVLAESQIEDVYPFSDPFRGHCAVVLLHRESCLFFLAFPLSSRVRRLLGGA